MDAMWFNEDILGAYSHETGFIKIFWNFLLRIILKNLHILFFFNIGKSMSLWDRFMNKVGDWTVLLFYLFICLLTLLKKLAYIHLESIK